MAASSRVPSSSTDRWPATTGRRNPHRPAGLRRRRPAWSTVIGVVADARQQLRRAGRATSSTSRCSRPGQLSTTWLVRSPMSIPQRWPARSAMPSTRSIPNQPVDNFRTLADVRRVLAASPDADRHAARAVRSARPGDHRRRARRRRRLLGQPADPGVRHPHGARRGAPTCWAWSSARACSWSRSVSRSAPRRARPDPGVLTTLLFDVRPNDGLTYLAVSMALILVALGRASSRRGAQRPSIRWSPCASASPLEP